MAYKLDGTTPVLWADLTSTTDPVTFAAHYPRQTTAVNDPEVYRFVLMGNAGDDLLLATDTKSPGQRVDLTFRHLMHRLTINLLAGPGVTDTELDDAYITTVKAPGGGGIMPESVTVNLLTGQVTPYAASQKITYRGGRNVDWIVVPQTLTPGADWLKITRDNDVWHFPVPDLDLSLEGNQTELKSGKHLTLTLTLKKTPAGGNQVELTSTGIGAWANQAVIKDDVDLGGGTAITTPAQLRAALEGAGTDPIVINGDPTPSLDAHLTLGADHPLSIATGATLTIANAYSIERGHTPTPGRGGTCLFAQPEQNYYLIDRCTPHFQRAALTF